MGMRRAKRMPLLRNLTLGGTRTRNPRFRRPMPYPLGHEGGGLRWRVEKNENILFKYNKIFLGKFLFQELIRVKKSARYVTSSSALLGSSSWDISQ
ncbi:hypothetical protein TNCV_2089491 [Trichonephila clavipes]|nr:hypothetical protein TNCV_2089491 [Trichonephila clavipes]